jgi:SHS2 domain-containing protein
MSFRWVEHTAEVELDLVAESEEGVFADALAALAELIGGGAASAPREPIAVALDGTPDRAVLLADWIAELAFLAETRGLVPERLEALELATDGLRATLLARPGRPPHLVKGVTYHRLTFQAGPVGAGYRATVVLDV